MGDHYKSHSNDHQWCKYMCISVMKEWGGADMSIQLICVGTSLIHLVRLCYAALVHNCGHTRGQTECCSTVKRRCSWSHSPIRLLCHRELNVYSGHVVATQGSLIIEDDTVFHSKVFCQFFMAGLVNSLDKCLPISWKIACLCLPSRPLAQHVTQAV